MILGGSRPVAAPVLKLVTTTPPATPLVIISMDTRGRYATTHCTSDGVASLCTHLRGLSHTVVSARREA